VSTGGLTYERPEQKLRGALAGYLMWAHGCDEGNSCYPDCAELVTDATNDWMAAIDRWGVSGPHMISDGYCPHLLEPNWLGETKMS
jgi:hypothetical protein